MKKLSVLLLLSAGAFAANAQSLGNWYGEATFQMQTLEDTSSDELGKFKNNSLNLTVGKIITNNIAVEGFYNLPSTTQDKDYGANGTLSVKSKGGYGFAVRPFVNVTNEIELFARVGRGHGKMNFTGIDSNGDPFDTTEKNSNNFYGFGAAYKLSTKVSVVADYKKITGTEGSKVSLTGIGLRYNF
jgi:hypothetical protein